MACAAAFIHLLLAAGSSGFGSGPLAPTSSQSGAWDRCWVEPLQVSLADLAATGRIMEQIVDGHCASRVDRDHAIKFEKPSVVAKTRLGSFTLFGERLSWGLDMVMFPGRDGSPGTIYTAPALDLPERWMWAIDKATYPILIVGGAAIITTVILEMLK